VIRCCVLLYGGRIRRFREKFNKSETDDPKGVEEFRTCRKAYHMDKSCVVDVARRQIQLPTCKEVRDSNQKTVPERGTLKRVHQLGICNRRPIVKLLTVIRYLRSGPVCLGMKNFEGVTRGMSLTQ
jgi:hypothetical protein